MIGGLGEKGNTACFVFYKDRSECCFGNRLRWNRLQGQKQGEQSRGKLTIQVRGDDGLDLDGGDGDSEQWSDSSEYTVTLEPTESLMD